MGKFLILIRLPNFRLPAFDCSTIFKIVFTDNLFEQLKELEEESCFYKEKTVKFYLQKDFCDDADSIKKEIVLLSKSIEYKDGWCIVKNESDDLIADIIHDKIEQLIDIDLFENITMNTQSHANEQCELKN